VVARQPIHPRECRIRRPVYVNGIGFKKRPANGKAVAHCGETCFPGYRMSNKRTHRPRWLSSTRRSRNLKDSYHKFSR